MNKLKEKDFYERQSFEEIKHIDEFGGEYWYARELQELLEYKEWKTFKNVMKKAMLACKNNGIKITDEFIGFNVLSRAKSRKILYIEDYKLSRFACYLIIQNGDSRKKTIALAKSYIIMQTIKRELNEKENILKLK